MLYGSLQALWRHETVSSHASSVTALTLMWDQGFLLSTSADSRLNLWKLDKAGAGGDAYVTFADGVVLDVYDVQDIATFQRCLFFLLHRLC